MLDLLIKLLTPTFEGMGVSPVDVENYVHDLSGYIYGVLFILLAVIVLCVLAHFLAKKGKRHLIRWTSIVAGVVGICVIANAICLGPMYNNLAPIVNGSASVREESVQASKEVISRIGDEGIVLLRNNGLLPLAEGSNLNVFGWASIQPIFGGTGSGSSDTSTAVGILDSLSSAGFVLNTEISDMYTAYSPTRNLGGNVVSVSFTDWSLPEATQEYYTDSLMSNAQAHSDTAVIVLARSGGEGQDLPRDMNAVIKGTYNDYATQVAHGDSSYSYFACSYQNNSPDYDDFDPGESYLQLSNTEEMMIDKVCQSFEKVVLVINANNPMELGWTENYPQIGAIILAPGTGSNAMEGLGRIMDGEVNPSARTIETYLYDLKASPSYYNSGAFNYTNPEIDDIYEDLEALDSAYQGTVSFVQYVEGIYVGYKFYETAFAEYEAGHTKTNYYDNVFATFGSGLSYTTFTQEMEGGLEGDQVSLDVTVTNTGEVAGKEVVELYFTPPYTNGGIEKSAVNLIDFGKTEILQPGDSQVIHFDIPLEDMAAYDSKGLVAAAGSGYVLEEGDYVLSVRANAHDVLDEVTVTVDSTIDYSSEGRASDGIPAVNHFQDYSAGSVSYLSRADGFANFEEVTAAPAEAAYTLSEEDLATILSTMVINYDPTLYEDPDAVMPTTGAKNGKKLADYRNVPYDDPSWEELLDQLTVEEMTTLLNLGGFQTAAAQSVGKISMYDSDGTAGLNDWYIGVYGTPYPAEILISQTWNKELAYEVGLAYAQEFLDCNIYGWYGPAMNTHRTAFNGRNFEYFSEDGVLAGYIASAEINAAGTQGIYAYIKHFVMNDQETNRCALLLTWSDEQAIREIYMKPFELCVKNYDFAGFAPLAVMSSFNFIGTKWAGADADLLNTVLRGEWGFVGHVLTDWNGSYGYQNADSTVRNGGDAMLGFYLDRYSNVLTDTESPTLVSALRRASKNILYTSVNSAAYEESRLNAGGMDKLTKMFVIGDVCVGVVSAAILLLVFLRYFSKKKKAAREAGA